MANVQHDTLSLSTCFLLLSNMDGGCILVKEKIVPACKMCVDFSSPRPDSATDNSKIKQLTQ